MPAIKAKVSLIYAAKKTPETPIWIDLMRNAMKNAQK